jgi:bile acid-coenzyme A ligase
MVDETGILGRRPESGEVLRAAGFPIDDAVRAELTERYCSFPEEIRRYAADAPDEVALTFVPKQGEPRELTWRELDEASTQVAHLLVERGVGPTSVVVVGLPNSVEHVVATFAVWHTGGCVLPVSSEAPPRERDQLLEIAQPTLVVTDADDIVYPTLSTAELGTAKSRPTTPLPDVLSHPGKAMGTGGSTGRPKIIVTPYPWVVDRQWDTEPAYGAMGARRGQRVLVPGPLYHNWPWDLTFRGMISGRPVVLMERFTAEQCLDAFARYKVQYAGLVPTMMRRMALLPEAATTDFSALEGICHTAAACPPVVKRAWIDLIGPERIYELYGASENFGLCIVRGDEWLSRPSTVGRPVEAEVLIVDADGNPVGPGVVGDVFTRSKKPETSGFYVGAPPARTVGDGWSSVGDIGWVDEDGFVFLGDRSADLIISGGANIYPAEVEAALLEHNGLADAVVIGLPDEDLGRIVHAIVEPRAGIPWPTEDELRAHCAALLSRPKQPRSFEIVDALPRSVAGKIRRSALAAERSPVTTPSV